ncbi:Leucine-rich repeat protein kinase family protein [Euphorbia peplus]|nr:Leucine-rich repeat protein kinase family protein [Euphorbia peplus]
MKSQLRLLSIIFFLEYSSIVVSELASDRASLLAIRAAMGGGSLTGWNISNENPCHWTGITCQVDRVVHLRLPGMSLSGKLPVALGNLTKLRTLSLGFNAFSGPIPSELGNLASLQYLYLQGNLFSGEIPEFLFDLKNLVQVNLGYNNFSGAISSNFNKLRRLTSLHLEKNRMNGSIPDMSLKSLDEFNVSFNKLTGSIPELLSSYPVSSFEGNDLCGKPLLLCNVTSTRDSHTLFYGAIFGVVIGCLLGCLCTRKRIKAVTKDVKQIEISMADTDTNPDPAPATRSRTLRMASSVLKFDLEDLLRASAEVLGKGTFGTSYKAFLDRETVGSTVVVKRMKSFDMSEKDFGEMVEAIEKISHENLFPLRASYFTNDERLLVHDYMPMGSLFALLHGKKGADRTPLDWNTRIGIALGAARAIAHLHAQSPSTFHGRIKSSNVLLTETFEVRVSDYGLAHYAGPIPDTNRTAGYQVTGEIVSQKTDIYSYGVLFLELLTGKDPNDPHLKDEGIDLPVWVLSAVNDEWTSEVFDVEILQCGNLEEVLLQLLELAFNCTSWDPDSRPSMVEVISRIEMLCCSSSYTHETHTDVGEH